MKRAGKPYDWDRIKSLSSYKATGSRSWQMLKAAVAWRVMRRYFARSNKVRIEWDSALKQGADGPKIYINQMMYDDMADQILILGGFEDKRIRDKKGKKNVR